MTTLPEFLLAQIEADEAVARAATEGKWWHDGPTLKTGKWWIDGGNEAVGKVDRRDDAEHIARHDPARVLRECAAKRAIVERQSAHAAASHRDPSDCPDLRALASVYADREGFDAGWLL